MVLILHTGLYENGLALWGETTVDPGRPLPPKTKPTSSVLPKYIYDAGPEALFSAMCSNIIIFKPRMAYFQQARILLPATDYGPIPSSPLISPSSQNIGPTRLAPCLVTVYPLGLEQAIEFLCLCSEKRILSPGLMVGADLAYWNSVLRFAGSLIARQKYLPGLVLEGKKYRSRWEPVFSGADSTQMETLAKNMPGAARALHKNDEDAAGSRSASELLKELLTSWVDFMVREAGQEKPGEESGWERPRTTKHFNSVHDAWLNSLRSENPKILWDHSELAQLLETIKEWRRPVSVSASSPFRLCFRLEEPRSEQAQDSDQMETDPGAWQVRYLLNPHQDPSLMIPITAALKTRGQASILLKRHGGNPREYVLSSLGQAASICPRIAESLQAAAPEGYQLDSVGAYEFLNQKAMALESAGFGVILPAWWTRKGTKLKLSARAQVKSGEMKTSGMLSLDSLVEFNWTLALGDQELSLRELEALARLKAPLVKVRGQWVEMRAEEIAKALEFWKNRSGGKVSAREILRMALDGSGAVEGINFSGIEAGGWIGELLERLKGKLEYQEISQPKKFQGALRPYQVRGFSWLGFLRQWGLGACLADDMGLGKTIQALALIQRDRHSGCKKPVLLVCPTTVVNNWLKEANRFTPELKVMVHHGIGRKKGEAFEKAAQKQAMVISSYALLHRDLAHLQKVEWAGLILDEAQNIKNYSTKQAQAARSLKSDYRIALTGTPVENNIGDLYSIMEFLNPGFLGGQESFKRNFFIPIQAGRDPHATERLKRITSPFLLRRLKTDKSIISDLPDKQEMKVFCPLTREQASLYAAVLKDTEAALNQSEGIQRKGLILATLSKLKQVCNHPAQFLGDNSAIADRSGKLTRLCEMLEEILEAGDRALVFSQFAEMGQILKRHLQETFGREILFLYGGVSKKQRDLMVERFQNQKDPLPVFILSLKAGGTGLNLTAASHVFHFDRWWNPAVENQATDRAFRIGQTRDVQVHKFVCAGTLEEKIDEMIESKKELAENVVGAGEGWLTELSNDELRNIFALRREAVGE